MSVHAKLLSGFREALEEGGLSRAMRFLNQSVAYRFSAVYVFSGGTLRNICLIDKLESEVSKSDDIPIEESYCVFIRRSAKPFSVNDSLNDPRVDGHSKQQMIHCTCMIRSIKSRRCLKLRCTSKIIIVRL